MCHTHEASLTVSLILYLRARVAQPPAPGCIYTLHCQTLPAAEGLGCHLTEGGGAGGPLHPVFSGLSCPGGSRPLQSWESHHMANGHGDHSGLKSESLKVERKQRWSLQSEDWILLFSAFKKYFLNQTQVVPSSTVWLHVYCFMPCPDFSL